MGEARGGDEDLEEDGEIHLVWVPPVAEGDTRGDPRRGIWRASAPERELPAEPEDVGGGGWEGDGDREERRRRRRAIGLAEGEGSWAESQGVTPCRREGGEEERERSTRVVRAAGRRRGEEEEDDPREMG